MHITDFENYIEPEITLRRGVAYYLEGNVLLLEEQEHNHYKAVVAGTQLYEVTLTLDDDYNIDEIACTCPYDWGEHCKHEVAVLYALRKKLKSENGREDQECLESVDVKALLEGRSKEELLSFLLEQSEKSPALVSELVIAFPSSDDEVNLKNLKIEFRQACERGIAGEYCGEEYEREYATEEDFVYHFTDTLKKKVDDLIAMARSAIMGGRIRYGGAIAAMMVHELADFDCFVDHLVEDVEGAMSLIVSLFDGIELSGEDASWLFEQLFTEAKGCDIQPQTTLLRFCIQLAEAAEDQEVLQNYLVDLASEESEVAWGHNLTILNSILLQHALLLRQGKLEDAQGLALANLKYDSLAKSAFEYALANGEYALAEKIAIEKANTSYPVYGAPDWGNYLYRVYKESGDRERMRSLAKAYLLQGNLTYYPILKENYTEDEWRAVVDPLLDELQATSNRTGIYPAVLKAEKKLERLLAYVKMNPYQVRSYRDVLLAEYEEDVFLLYKKIIVANGKTVSSRPEYRGLASILKELVTLGGEGLAMECIEALEPRYKKRPAMKDELKKAGVL